jgi:antitoxin component of MazEF toxin-antitoxin module
MARRVRVQQLPNGQFVVTIPKALAEAIGFRKGEQVQWAVERDRLILRRLTGKR